jgi:hypothetical protein
MNALQDRRVLAAVGAGAALLAGVLIALFLTGRDKPTAEVAPETKGGLQVEMSADVARLDPARPLRCFVGGQFVGLATLVECATRNGVSAQSLDVGLDESGELAAGGELAALQPLPTVTAPTRGAAGARRRGRGRAGRRVHALRLGRLALRRRGDEPERLRAAAVRRPLPASR